MSILDGLMGGLVGGSTAAIVGHLIEQHGGVQGIVSQFEQQGLGQTVRSWVGTGANQAVSAADIQQVFGADRLNALAAKFGLDPQEVSQKLAAALPQVIDRLTPGGTVTR
jgi:uncharacterized protein YidB (DUF937 family)